MHSNKFGIMQGRLSNAPDNDNLDWFPLNQWSDEFRYAEDLGFQTIEIVIDKEKNIKNPIWTSYGRNKILNAFKKSKLKAYSSCINFIITNSISREDVFVQACNAIDFLSEIGIELIVLPLFEKSDLKNIQNHKNIKKILELNKNIDNELIIEVDLQAKDLLKTLESLEIYDVGIVYDIGNSTFLGHQIGEDLDLLEEKIKHIHIKDKDSFGKNVLLGEGNCDFDFFFHHPFIRKYNGFYTLETSRGINPIESAVMNLDFLKKYLSRGL
jgi:sugar phosphate isomerase/epimerase